MDLKNYSEYSGLDKEFDPEDLRDLQACGFRNPWDVFCDLFRKQTPFDAEEVDEKYKVN